MTTELKQQLPPLYATEQQPVLEKIAYTCYFLPDSRWYWYPVEFDGTNLFFGLVAGAYVELGYFQLSELESLSGLWGLPVERNLYWTPIRLREVLEEHRDRPGAEVF